MRIEVVHTGEASTLGDLKFELRPLFATSEDLIAAQSVFDAAPDFARVIQGTPFDDSEASRLFRELPPGVDASAKSVLGVYSDSELVGLVDLVRGFPAATTAMLGLLVIVSSRRRRGLGMRAVQEIEGLATSWACDRVRIGVVRANATGLAFWEAMGYSPTGETRPWQAGTVHSEVVAMEKHLL